MLSENKPCGSQPATTPAERKELDHPLGWKISYTDAEGVRQSVLCGHNSVADYRGIDPLASSIALGPFGSMADHSEAALNMVGVDSGIKNSALRIINAVARWSETPNAVPWRDLELRIEAELQYTRCVASSNSTQSSVQKVFTYIQQPGNLGAWRVGEACHKAARASAGDYIDRGLGLLKELQAKGYGIVALDPNQDQS